MTESSYSMIRKCDQNDNNKSHVLFTTKCTFNEFILQEMNIKETRNDKQNNT